MMTFMAQLRATAPSVLAGHMVGCVVAGVGLMLVSHMWEAPSVGMFFIAVADGILAAIVSALLGAIPIWLYGWPAYSWLVKSAYSSYLTVTGLALLPVAVLLPFSVGNGFFALFSLPVALITHFFYSRGGPNKSFKPMPLRGTA